MATFVRGLWGDDKIVKYPKVLVDVVFTAAGKQHPTPIVTYVYGSMNQSFLSCLHVEATSMSNEAVCSWGSKENRAPLATGKPARWGEINWGVSTWRHKLAIMQQAIEEFGEVLWLDWDCVLDVAELPDDFWARMNQGQPLQASLLRFKRPKLNWCKGDVRYLQPHGAFIYCREKKIITDLLALSAQYPDYYDELLIALWVENCWGRSWQLGDDKRWMDEGWEPFEGCYRARNQVRVSARSLFREGVGKAE